MRRRCRYYLNTSFFCDLEDSVRDAVLFVRRFGGRGRLCTSSILLYEFRAVGKGYVARRLAALYGIRVVKVPVLRYRALAQYVCRFVLGIANPSSNTVWDVAHVLVARDLRAVFVSSDEASLKRAKKLGVEALNFREVF